MYWADRSRMQANPLHIWAIRASYAARLVELASVWPKQFSCPKNTVSLCTAYEPRTVSLPDSIWIYLWSGRSSKRDTLNSLTDEYRPEIRAGYSQERFRFAIKRHRAAPGSIPNNRTGGDGEYDEHFRVVHARVCASVRCSSGLTLTQARGQYRGSRAGASSCTPEWGEELTIFAQIEPKAAGSSERLLLRLPDLGRLD